VTIKGANAAPALGAFGSTDAVAKYYVEELTIGASAPAFEITGAFGGETLKKVNLVAGNTAFAQDAAGAIFNANQTAILFDSDNKEKFYLKNADANGVPTLEKYIKIKEEDVPKQEETGYVSKKEFDELKSQFEKNIGDLQKLLQQPSVLKKGE
jgi:hypothetical protein